MILIVHSVKEFVDYGVPAPLFEKGVIIMFFLPLLGHMALQASEMKNEASHASHTSCQHGTVPLWPCCA